VAVVLISVGYRSVNYKQLVCFATVFIKKARISQC
jgi:hypothetical protein